MRDAVLVALHRLSMLAPASSSILAIPLLEDGDEDVRVACCACLGGAVASDALPILYRQLWKYPSTRTVEMLQRKLASSVRSQHRPLIESTLGFLVRLEAMNPSASA
jgi:hypothetical protein